MKVLVACLITSVTFSTSAALVASDSFDYSAGSIDGQNGGTGFSGAWSSPTAEQVTSGSLSQIGLPTAGNKLEITGGGSTITVSRPANIFDLSADATHYVSVLMNKGGTGGQSGEFAKLHFQATSGFFGGFEFRSDEKVALQTRAGAVTGTEVLALNTDYLFVMKIVTTAASVANGDVFSLAWFKAGDAIPANEASITWDLTYSINNGAPGNSSAQFISGASITTGYDELKIGTEFGDVIPEPATLGLVGLVGAALLAGRRIMSI